VASPRPRPKRSFAKRLSDGNFFNDPRVSVLEEEFSSQGISILGEVQKPGSIRCTGHGSCTARSPPLAVPLPGAGNTVSLLPRSDSQKAEVVTLSYDGKASSQSNIYVYPGDTIVVSKAGVGYVVGDVRLPGGFVMENSRMTILQAYAMAQGAGPFAALDRAQLIRKAGSERLPQETQISLKNILAAKSPDINLQPDDILFVPTIPLKRSVCEPLKPSYRKLVAWRFIEEFPRGTVSLARKSDWAALPVG
jgi:polysaccharide biosynthesis/export protein